MPTHPPISDYEIIGDCRSAALLSRGAPIEWLCCRGSIVLRASARCTIGSGAGGLRLRRIECIEGEVEIEVVCERRLHYGRTVPRLRDHGRLGLYYDNGGQALILRSEIPLARSSERASTGC